MTGALEGLGLPRPSEKALRDLRRRLGPAPAKAVFKTVAVPLASPWTRRVTWRGLRTVAFDGLNSVHVPDGDPNRSWLGKLRNRLGPVGLTSTNFSVCCSVSSMRSRSAAASAPG